MNDALAAQNANLFETAFSGLTSGAVNNSALIGSIITGTSPFATQFNGLGSSLAQQMPTAPRSICQRATMGLLCVFVWGRKAMP